MDHSLLWSKLASSLCFVICILKHIHMSELKITPHNFFLVTKVFAEITTSVLFCLLISIFYLGFSEVPMRLVCTSSVNELSKRLHDRYFQGWSSSLKCTNGKLRTYKLIFLVYENYLSLPPHLRVPLTRFRMSSHPLRLEIGRYHRSNTLPVEDRLCQMCNLSTVKDELHFLLHCRIDQLNVA